MKSISNFLKETWNRILGPSPSYFSIIQKISAAITILSGLPLLLQQLQAQTGLIIPTFMTAFSNKIFMFCGVIAFLIARLPVKNPDALKTKKDGEIVKKLPFTNNETITNP